MSFFWSFLVLKAKPKRGICDSDFQLLLFLLQWALLVEYTGIALLAAEMLETAFLGSAAPPSIWVATAVGFGILLSRLSHSLSCLSVLGKG